MNAKATLALVLSIGLASTGCAAAQGVGGGPPYTETVSEPPLGPREPTPEARPPDGGARPGALTGLAKGGGRLPQRGKLVMLSKKRGG